MHYIRDIHASFLSLTKSKISTLLSALTSLAVGSKAESMFNKSLLRSDRSVGVKVAEISVRDSVFRRVAFRARALVTVY